MSYCPSTFEARNDSSEPSSTPVTLRPTACTTGPGGRSRFSCAAATAGASSSRKASTLAVTQPVRSTTRTSSPGVATRPVVSAT